MNKLSTGRKPEKVEVIPAQLTTRPEDAVVCMAKAMNVLLNDEALWSETRLSHLNAIRRSLIEIETSSRLLRKKYCCDEDALIR